MDRIIYCSTAKDSVTLETISSIVKAAAANNKEHGISGFLLFNQKFFVQVLEGESESLNHTYHKIVRDDRHEKLVILSLERNIPFRKFFEWDLAFVTLKKTNRDLYLKYLPVNEFNPYLLNASSSLGFMEDMVKTQKTEG